MCMHTPITPTHTLTTSAADKLLQVSRPPGPPHPRPRMKSRAVLQWGCLWPQSASWQHPWGGMGLGDSPCPHSVLASQHALSNFIRQGHGVGRVGEDLDNPCDFSATLLICAMAPMTLLRPLCLSGQAGFEAQVGNEYREVKRGRNAKWW